MPQRTEMFPGQLTLQIIPSSKERVQVFTGKGIAVQKLMPTVVCLHKQAEGSAPVLQDAWKRNFKGSLRH